ncbi:hypothetical protein HDV02_006510 [Globomyces sp. JEL0801]|nr:hypothetical protein HDV02_006510 [Globomyces sp. JEL0801]
MGNANSTDQVDISHFKLQQVIGKGGFGMVRIVQKRDTKVKFALKYINKKKCVKKDAVRNIFRERLILEKCNHPFIINLQFAFQDDAHMFMVLDLALGGDLRFHLMRVGCLPEQTVKIYTAEISSAIAYLHSLDIIHRDLKPENLLLDERGHIHVTDFNVAVMLNQKIPSSKSGTAAYMAPEMLIHKPYAYSVDWWGLGIIIYECTYNIHPFLAEKRMPLEKAIKELPIVFPDPSTLRAEYYPVFDSPNRTLFIRGLLNRSVPDRLAHGREGFKEIVDHVWMEDIDWRKLERMELIPDFIPDPTQNNYDFGPALEELLYDSAPLSSKPVRKKKKNPTSAPPVSQLWDDDSKIPKSSGNKETEMEYIEIYFRNYTKHHDMSESNNALQQSTSNEGLDKDLSGSLKLSNMLKNPFSKRSHSRAGKSIKSLYGNEEDPSRGATDFTNSSRSTRSEPDQSMLHEEQLAFKTGAGMQSFSMRSSESLDLPPVPDPTKYRSRNHKPLGISTSPRDRPSSNLVQPVSPLKRPNHSNTALGVSPERNFDYRHLQKERKMNSPKSPKPQLSTTTQMLFDKVLNDVTDIPSQPAKNPMEIFDMNDLDLSFPETPYLENTTDQQNSYKHGSPRSPRFRKDRKPTPYK